MLFGVSGNTSSSLSFFKTAYFLEKYERMNTRIDKITSGFFNNQE